MTIKVKYTILEICCDQPEFLAEVSAAAIFGDADDISSEEEKDKDESDREVRRRSIDEDEDRRRSDEENEMQQPEEVLYQIINFKPF